VSRGKFVVLRGKGSKGASKTLNNQTSFRFWQKTTQPRLDGTLETEREGKQERETKKRKREKLA